MNYKRSFLSVKLKEIVAIRFLSDERWTYNFFRLSNNHPPANIATEKNRIKAIITGNDKGAIMDVYREAYHNENIITKTNSTKRMRMNQGFRERR